MGPASYLPLYPKKAFSVYEHVQARLQVKSGALGQLIWGGVKSSQKHLRVLMQKDVSEPHWGVALATRLPGRATTVWPARARTARAM